MRTLARELVDRKSDAGSPLRHNKGLLQKANIRATCMDGVGVYMAY